MKIGSGHVKTGWAARNLKIKIRKKMFPLISQNAEKVLQVKPAHPWLLHEIPLS